MRINGRQLAGPSVEVLVIPRPDAPEGDIVFKAKAVNDFDEFNKLVPEPQPPKVQKRGETAFTPDFDNAKYRAELKDYSAKQTNYMIIKSLEATPDLVWERVKINEPATWAEYILELKEAGFSQVELGKIVQMVTAANGMSEDRYREARLRFLQSQAAAT